MMYQVPPHIEVRVVHDELVVLDTRNATYHALNPAASLIWAVLAEGGSQNAAVDALVTRFRITPERARVDVESTIRLLTERALLDPDAP